MAFRRPRTAAAICFTIFALVFILLIAREALQLHDLALDRRHRELEYRALVIQDNLKSGLQALSFLRATAEHFLDRRSTQEDLKVEPALEEAYRVRDQRTWSVDVGGNSPPIQGVRPEVLAGLPGFKRREDTFAADLLLAALMSRASGQVVLEHPFTSRMIFISSNGFFVSYPSVADGRVEELTRLIAVRPYFQGALRADADTSRYILPSESIREERASPPVLAFSTPIRVHGAFRGAVVLTTHKAYLDGLLQSASLSSHRALLLDKRGEVLASRDDDYFADEPDALALLRPVAKAGPVQPLFGAVRWPGHGQLLYRWVNEDWLIAQPVSLWELYGPTFLQLTPLAIALLATVSILLLITFRMAMLLMDHQIRAEAASRNLALRDPMTGLANRRFFAERFETAAQECQKAHQPLSFVMFDVDHFKQINDHWGHASGDAVLKTLAKTAALVVRTSDAVMRLGGEEFGILLPGVAADNAAATAERLRGALAEARCAPVGKDGQRLTDGEAIRFTASFGVAEALTDGSFEMDVLMAIADERLYQAKQGGRNRVIGRKTSDAPRAPIGETQGES